MRGSRNSSPETRRGGGRPLPQMPNTVAVQRRKYVLTQSEKCEGWENGGRGRRRPGGGLGGGDGPAVLEGQEAADLRGPLPVGHPLHRELEERRGRGRRAGIHRGVKGRGGAGPGHLSRDASGADAPPPPSSWSRTARCGSRSPSCQGTRTAARPPMALTPIRIRVTIDCGPVPPASGIRNRKRTPFLSHGVAVEEERPSPPPTHRGPLGGLGGPGPAPRSGRCSRPRRGGRGAPRTSRGRGGWRPGPGKGGVPV